ncbi:MAG: hypothetical protein NTZ12_07545 [Candidatus Aminicenantes bacterium]|nr:hypothetical protein [Candidatus Aminicenantes bacterium]
MKRLVRKKTKSKNMDRKLREETRHAYLLRGIPDKLWRTAKAYAGKNGTTIREIILTSLWEKTK